jgi:dTDP-4-amino-4,6-dideoxygalactose transaminase
LTRARTQPRYRLYGGLGLYARFAADYAAGWHRSDALVPAFEAELAARFGSAHAVMTSMARVALYDLVRFYVRPGQRVLLSPYTIVDVVNMVVAAGAVPTFVDVDPTTGNLDPAALKRGIVPGCALVIVTHLHGVSADLHGVLEVARRAGLPMVEDAAQCMGATVDGRAVGTHGDAGVFSFGSFKNINAHFGGVVLTQNASLAASLRDQQQARPLFDPSHLRRKARESLASAMLLGPAFPLAYPVIRYGAVHEVEAINRATRIELSTDLRADLPGYYLGRFTDLQVRAAQAQLPLLDAHTRQRIATARAYDAGLRGLPGITVPPAPQGRAHVYGYYPLIVAPERRADLVRHLQRAWRDAAPQHLHDVSALPDFRQFGGDCPNASRVAGGVVLLSTWPGYAQVEPTVAAVRAWAR